LLLLVVVDKVRSISFLLDVVRELCNNKLKLAFVKVIEEDFEEPMCAICIYYVVLVMLI